MNPKTILGQALKFRDKSPQNSSVKSFIKEAHMYQELHNAIFISAKSRQPTKVLDWDMFFEFLSDSVANKTISSFDDIDDYLKRPDNRLESIERRGDSKSSYVKVFDKTLLIQRDKMPAQLFTEGNIGELEDFDTIIAIENAETFLTIAESSQIFDSRNYLYLGGHANTLTQRFIKDKEVQFFVDFDIVSMNMYEDFECDRKSLFIPRDIESYFLKYPNEGLYKKQRHLLREAYESDASQVIVLIKKYSTVVEQEIVR